MGLAVGGEAVGDDVGAAVGKTVGLAVALDGGVLHFAGGSATMPPAKEEGSAGKRRRPLLSKAFKL